MNTEHLIVGVVASGRMFNYGHKLYKNVDGKYFYIIPKKKPFFKFGEIFGLGNRQGESINVDALNIALENQAVLVFVYPLAVYTIGAKEFFDYALKHDTFRPQNAGIEATYSAPLDEMKYQRRVFG